jgi:CheY-like chemotaxis protein
MRDDRSTHDEGSAASTAAVVAPDELVDLAAIESVAGLAQVVRRLYGRPLRVVLVTDDDDSAAHFGEAAEESVLDVSVEVLSGVDEAIERLDRALSGRRRRNVPDVVVSALEIDESHRLLSTWRPASVTDAVPIIVLSDDNRPGLERRSFALGAAGHMRAPDRQYERVALIHALPDFLPQFRPAE